VQGDRCIDGLVASERLNVREFEFRLVDLDAICAASPWVRDNPCDCVDYRGFEPTFCKVVGIMPRALFLRHHTEDRPGLIGVAFEGRGYELDVAMMDEFNPTPSLDNVDVLVILGSKSAVYDIDVEAAWFGRELGLIADAVQRDIPIFGICFGAQALCQFHGGVVEPSSEPEIGWYEVEALNGSRISSGPWFEFHFDRCTLPEGAELWASTPRAIQAFAIGRNVGVQFHPEIDDVQLREWFSTGEEYAREFGADPDELLAQTANETPAARNRAVVLVDLFLDHSSR
jgi:GMP synthase-like glutamine amidotransferase